MLNLNRSAWTRVRFGDVVNRSREQAGQGGEAVERYVAGGHFDEGALNIVRHGVPDDGGMGSTFTYAFHPGQVLYVSASWYLRKVGVATFDGVVADKTYVLESKDTALLSQRFLPWILMSNSLHDYAAAQSTGSMNSRLLWGTLSRFEFDLPPLEEQQRIADLLWAVEGQRESLVAESTAIHSISRVLSSQILNDYPWDARLGDVLLGITAGRSFPGKSTPVGSPDTYGVLRISAVSANGFLAAENKELLRQDDFLPQYAIRKGDLLITRANTVAYVGRPAIVDGDYDNLMLSDKTLRLDPDPDRTSVNFLREYLLTPRVREAITAAATGTGAAMKNLSQQDIRTLPIPRMSLAQQAEFLTQVGRVRAAHHDMDGELSTLRMLQQALLADVLKG